MPKNYIIIHYHTVESTMDIAYSFAKKEPDKLVLIISKQQEKGRGRKESKWFSPEGGFWGTFILQIKENYNVELARLSHYTAALIVIKALEKFYDIKLSIKWPNDIYYQGKKVGGILIEYITGEKKYLLIGIGININNSFSTLKEKEGRLVNKATSMIDITNKKIEIKELAITMAELIATEFMTLLNNQERLIALLNNKLSCLKKEVILDNSKKLLCAGINKQGMLILKDKNCNKFFFDIGESERVTFLN